MTAYYLKNIGRVFNTFICCVALSGCVGTVVGTAVDTAIEIVKIPFKAGAAVIDVVTPDEFIEHPQPINDHLEAEENAMRSERETL